jgi:hypothetical protein
LGSNSNDHQHPITESRQPYGERAKQALSDLVSGKLRGWCVETTDKTPFQQSYYQPPFEESGKPTVRHIGRFFGQKSTIATILLSSIEPYAKPAPALAANPAAR